MNNIRTHYDDLKVARDAPAEVIKAAYRALSQKHHPDKNSSDPESTKIMGIINDSYAILSDPHKRKEHDSWIKEQEQLQHKTGQKSETSNKSTSYKREENKLREIKKSSTNTFLYLCIPSLIVLVVFLYSQSNTDILNHKFYKPKPTFSELNSQTEAPPASAPELVSNGDKVLGLYSELYPDTSKPTNKQLRAELEELKTPAAAAPEEIPNTISAKEFTYIGLESELNLKPEVEKPVQDEHATKNVPQADTSPKKTFNEKTLFAPNGEPWPLVASYIQGYEKLNTNGLSSITVDNSQNDSNVFVKIVFLSNVETYPVRQFFIPAYGKFTANKLTAGNYDVRYRDLNSGELSRSESFSLEETEIAGGTQFSKHTMTLYKVRNGNMQNYSLSEAEF
jgi:curved DNA-binding protein CbpA